MQITYYIDDGYVGAHGRPQHTSVDDDELRECDSFEEAQKLIWEEIENDMKDKVHPVWNHESNKAEIEEIMADKQEKH